MHDHGDELRTVTVTICERCIAGEGGECHTPGCLLYMNRAPDVPLQLSLYMSAPEPS
jgi:hypothetical protein